MPYKETVRIGLGKGEVTIGTVWVTLECRQGTFRARIASRGLGKIQRVSGRRVTARVWNDIVANMRGTYERYERSRMSSAPPPARQAALF